MVWIYDKIHYSIWSVLENVVKMVIYIRKAVFSNTNLNWSIVIHVLSVPKVRIHLDFTLKGMQPKWNQSLKGSVTIGVPESCTVRMFIRNSKGGDERAKHYLNASSYSKKFVMLPLHFIRCDLQNNILGWDW